MLQNGKQDNKNLYNQQKKLPSNKQARDKGAQARFPVTQKLSTSGAGTRKCQKWLLTIKVALTFLAMPLLPVKQFGFRLLYDVPKILKFQVRKMCACTKILVSKRKTINLQLTRTRLT